MPSTYPQFHCVLLPFSEIWDMRKLEPGDKIDKTHGGEIIYTMVVLSVTEDRAYADIPGGSEPYIFLREHEGAMVRNVYPGSEGYVVHARH